MDETQQTSRDDVRNTNDDPTRIYSAAWFEQHGVQVLRHDRIITLPTCTEQQSTRTGDNNAHTI